MLGTAGSAGVVADVVFVNLLKGTAASWFFAGSAWACTVSKPGGTLGVDDRSFEPGKLWKDETRECNADCVSDRIGREGKFFSSTM